MPARIQMYDRNLTYTAGRSPARRMLPGALEMAVRERELVAGLISHRLPLADAWRRTGGWRAGGGMGEGGAGDVTAALAAVQAVQS